MKKNEDKICDINKKNKYRNNRNVENDCLSKLFDNNIKIR